MPRGTSRSSRVRRQGGSEGSLEDARELRVAESQRVRAHAAARGIGHDRPDIGGGHAERREPRDIQAGEVFSRDMIDVLRPATVGAIKPDQIENVLGTKAVHDFKYGQELRWTDLGA